MPPKNLNMRQKGVNRALGTQEVKEQKLMEALALGHGRRLGGEPEPSSADKERPGERLRCLGTSQVPVGMTNLLIPQPLRTAPEQFPLSFSCRL